MDRNRVNRFSVGSQSFDDEYLKKPDRNHNTKQVSELLGYLKEKKVNYSVDLLLGVPEATSKREILKEIDSFVDFNPNHFSVYILKTRKNYPHFDYMPDDESVRDEYPQGL